MHFTVCTWYLNRLLCIQLIFIWELPFHYWHEGNKFILCKMRHQINAHLSFPMNQIDTWETLVTPGVLYWLLLLGSGVQPGEGLEQRAPGCSPQMSSKHDHGYFLWSYLPPSRLILFSFCQWDRTTCPWHIYLRIVQYPNDRRNTAYFIFIFFPLNIVHTKEVAQNSEVMGNQKHLVC